MRERKFNKVLTLRLTDEQAGRLKEKADVEECSMTDIVREMIVDCLNQSPQMLVS